MGPTIIYGLEYQSRALCAQNVENDTRFFVGTHNIKQEENQIHLVTFDEEAQAVSAKIYPHAKGEIWKLTNNPHDALVLASCHTVNSGVEMGVSLLTVPEDVDGESVLSEQSLNIAAPEVKTAEFHPTSGNKMGVVTNSQLLVVDINQSEIESTVLADAGSAKLTTGKWALHHNTNQFIVLSDTTIKSYDMREPKAVAWTIPNAHPQLIRDLDCNPHKQCHIVTASDDGCLKIWDFRNAKEAVFSQSVHCHWIWSVRFNPFHDQLLLSSSSDIKVNLTSAFSVSSESSASPTENKGGGDEKRSVLADGLLESFDIHDDSVYCAEWSHVDPWTFATLSYDGRLVISKVDKEIKYKVLL